MATLLDFLTTRPEEAGRIASAASSNRAKGSSDPTDVAGDRYGHFYEQGAQNGLLDLLITQGLISPAYEFGVKPLIMASPAANEAFGNLFGKEQAADETTSPPSLVNVGAGLVGHTAGYLNNPNTLGGLLMRAVRR